MAIHGNKSQTARTKALADFKNGDLQVLVATDIAARGIDIDQLPHVVNFELPNVPEDYVHRIGRTGRAGATGEAISLVCVDENGFLRDIERLIKHEIPKEIVPGFEPPAHERPEPIVLGRMVIGEGAGRGGARPRRDGPGRGDRGRLARRQRRRRGRGNGGGTARSHGGGNGGGQRATVTAAAAAPRSKRRRQRRSRGSAPRRDGTRPSAAPRSTRPSAERPARRRRRVAMALAPAPAPPTALLAGATGLVGRALLPRCSRADRRSASIVLVRRPLPASVARRSAPAPCGSATSRRSPATFRRVDDVYIALGTTIKVAGSRGGVSRRRLRPRRRHRARRARGRRDAGSRVVSALGADRRSRVFYNRVKGEMEDAVAGARLRVGRDRPALAAARRPRGARPADARRRSLGGAPARAAAAGSCRQACGRSPPRRSPRRLVAALDRRARHCACCRRPSCSGFGRG